MFPAPPLNLADLAERILDGAGTDTTVTAVVRFFLAMILYPEVQKKAQEELDRVVGTDRLPSLDE